MAGSLEAWFRRKYNLPPHDPRFLAATVEDIETDFWMHHYADRGVTEEYETDGFDAAAEAARIEAEEEAKAAGTVPPDDWEALP